MKPIDYIIRDLELNSDLWEQGEFCLWKRNSPFSKEYDFEELFKIWTSNGFWFYGIHKPEEISFTFWEKIKFSWAYRIWRKSKKIKNTRKEEIIKKYCSNEELDELERMWKIKKTSK